MRLTTQLLTILSKSFCIYNSQVPMSQADMLTFQHVPTNRANRRLVVDHRLRRHCQSSLRRSRRRCGRSSRCSPRRHRHRWNGMDAVVTVIRCLLVYVVENVSVTIVYIIHTEIYVYKYVYIYIQRCKEMNMNADNWKVKRGKICGMCAGQRDVECKLPSFRPCCMARQSMMIAWQYPIHWGFLAFSS